MSWAERIFKNEPHQVIVIAAENLHSRSALPHTHLHFLAWLSYFTSSCHTCYSLVSPPCFLPLHLCSSAQPHLNAQPGISSPPALGIFTGMKKCHHPFLLTTQGDTKLLACLNMTEPVPLPVCRSGWCQCALIFHSLLCSFVSCLVLSCLQRLCSLSRLQRGAGEKVRRRERGAEKRAAAQP